jgi:eukaryotic-like serine/threonine-protein kinase
MASSPTSSTELIDLVRKSGLADDRLDNWLEKNPALPSRPQATAAKLVKDGLITPFHAKHMLTGKCKGFVLGQYKVLDQIGAGGMGVIFLGQHLTMKRQVAIKVLPTDKAKDEEARERFYREARIVAALDHPNVVRAFDVGQNGDTHFMVMEYIEGESLEELLRRKGPLSTREAADYIAQAARGLQHAYERGLVHRDIKPANLLLDKSGVVKVLDMGLARFFEENSNLTTELCSGSVIGTADYMAPEQAVNSHEVDIRADIYSLGVALYALLAGQPPYAGLTVPQKLLAHHMRQPEPIQTHRPDVPDELAEIVMKMLAKQLDERYQVPAEVDDALTYWIKAHDAASAPTGKTDNTVIRRYRRSKQEKEKKRRSVLLVAASAGAVLLILGVIIAIAALGDKKPTPTVAKDAPAAAPPETTAKPGNVVQRPVVPKSGELRQFATKGEQIERLALAPNEHTFVGGGVGGSIKVWDVDASAPYKDFKAHTGPVRFVSFAPSGALLASCGQDGSIKIWKTDDWTEKRKLLPNAGPIRAAVFSPDGKLVFAGGDDSLGRFWDVNSGALVRSCSKKHDKPLEKPNDKEKLEKPEKPINWVAWSPDGKFVYTAGWDGTVRGWDAATGAEKFVFSFNNEKRFQMVAVSADSSLLLCSSDSPVLHLLDARTGAKLKRNFFEDKMASQWGAVFSADGSLAASAGADRAIHVWDVATGTIYQTYPGLPGQATSCLFTGDGRYVIVALKEDVVRLFGVPPR